jgi:predicted RNA-binding protein
MAYWLCITNEVNWNVIKSVNIWGVPDRHKNTIAKVKPGDKLLRFICIRSDCRFSPCFWCCLHLSEYEQNFSRGELWYGITF